MRLKSVSSFDGYSYRARFLPALLVLLPVLLTIMILYPTVYNGTGAAVASLAIACGSLWFLANVVRAAGRAAEGRLVKTWGGLPTTCMLRHRDGILDLQTKGRYHLFLSSRISGLRLPTAEQETLNPEAADIAYRSAAKWLLEFTRDRSRFPLIFAENTSYGFRRNLYAARPVGLGLSVICLALLALAIADTHPLGLRDVPGPQLMLSVLLLLAVVCWTYFVNVAWVLDASRSYAGALLAACDAVQSASPTVAERRIIAP